jgi:hypothetical protein
MEVSRVGRLLVCPHHPPTPVTRRSLLLGRYFPFGTVESSIGRTLNRMAMKLTEPITITIDVSRRVDRLD